MSNEVGFGFQADVINTASLAHMLTGRVLKALSDGGVDTYAVAAAFWMGAKVPIRSSLADTVHAHISKRPNYQSVLSKALNIGWGHSAPVIEMTRTRAGTNGLLLVGAFATGVSPFQAAQCLSELLSAFDMSVDMLPSNDVLMGLVKYLGPFVHDLGFSKVLQHITHVCEGVMEAEYRYEKSVIKELGNPNVLAAAVKQLVYTSQMRQDHYMVLKIRGSWLPAFASHLLGMSVDIRCGDKIIWASGGDKGSVVFQLADHHMEQLSIQQSPMPLTIVERIYDYHQDPSKISIDCSLGDILDSQCLRWPQIDADINASIHAAVRRLSLNLLSRHHIYSAIQRDQDSGKFPHTHHQQMQAADEVKGLEVVLEAMNVKPQSTQPTDTFPRKIQLVKVAANYMVRTYIGPATHGIGFMERESVERMASRCDTHQAEAHLVAERAVDEESSWRMGLPQLDDLCFCQKVGRLIYGCAVMASSLSRCNFDASHLRVQESLIAGQDETEWSNSFIKYECDDSLFYEYTMEPLPAKKNDLFHYLGQLLCSDYDSSWMGRGKSTLGLSGGLYTMYYTCLMANESYDDLGRMISIRTGRASVAGSFRNVITESHVKQRLGSEGEFCVNKGLDAMDDLELSWLTGKCLLEPHRRPPRSKVFIDVAVLEKEISVRLRYTSRGGDVSNWEFTDCIRTFLTRWLVPRCDHPRDSVYEVSTDHTVGVGGFYLEEYMHKHSHGKVALFALKGNKLEQLLTCGIGLDKSRTETLDGFKRYGVLQLHACLKCSINLAQKSQICHPYVVMGG